MNFENIFAMLDWNQPIETQINGRRLAKKQGVVAPFILPQMPNYNKNIWDNCAIIIAEKNDEDLKLYLVELLEWLQDMNWPGAIIILDRLKSFSDKDFVCKTVGICVEKAKNKKDDIWMQNLLLVL